MKKEIIVGICVMLLITGILSGCTGEAKENRFYHMGILKSVNLKSNGDMDMELQDFNCPPGHERWITYTFDKLSIEEPNRNFTDISEFVSIAEKWKGYRTEVRIFEKGELRCLEAFSVREDSEDRDYIDWWL